MERGRGMSPKPSSERPHIALDGNSADAPSAAAPIDNDDQSARKMSTAKKLDLAAIPTDLLNSFIALYHAYIGSGGDVRRLSNIDLRMAAAQSSAMEKRRQSSAHRNSRTSLTETLEMQEAQNVPSFNFSAFVTQMREEFWASSGEADSAERKKAKSGASRWLSLSRGPWNRSLKTIEGKYGAAVMSYFSFLQHIMIVNAIVLLLTLLIIVPHYALHSGGGPTDASDRAKVCSANYTAVVLNFIENSEWYDYATQVFTGTGVMERQIFYGVYERSYPLPDQRRRSSYNMSLAMVTVPLSCLFVSLVLIMARASTYLSSSIRASRHAQAARYSAHVFSAWSHYVTDPKACLLQRLLIKNKLMNMLTKDSRTTRSRARNFARTLALLAVRVVSNMVILSLLAACGVLVFLVQNFSDELLGSVAVGVSPATELAVSFLTPFTITALYAIMRLLFELLVKLESYSSEVSMVITIVRSAALRLASLVLLFAKFFTDSWTCPDAAPSASGPIPADIANASAAKNLSARVCGNCRASEGRIQTYCWETYVGQQLYKLMIVDFLMILVEVFLIETPRRIIYERFKDKSLIVAKIGLPEFEIPKLVLDVAYTQTLCWTSVLFSPFSPAMTLISTIVLFYARKFSLERNIRSSSEISSSSVVRVFFLLLLCPFLLLSMIIIGVCITFLQPSQGCGPFREFQEGQHMIHAIPLAMKGLPAATSALNIVMDMKFLFGITMILCLFIYFNKAVAHGTDRLIELLDESKERIINNNKALWGEIHRKTKQMVDESKPTRRAPQGRRIGKSVLQASTAWGDRNALATSNRPLRDDETLELPGYGYRAADASGSRFQSGAVESERGEPVRKRNDEETTFLLRPKVNKDEEPSSLRQPPVSASHRRQPGLNGAKESAGREVGEGSSPARSTAIDAADHAGRGDRAGLSRREWPSSGSPQHFSQPSRYAAPPVQEYPVDSVGTPGPRTTPQVTYCPGAFDGGGARAGQYALDGPPENYASSLGAPEDFGEAGRDWQPSMTDGRQVALRPGSAVDGSHRIWPSEPYYGQEDDPRNPSNQRAVWPTVFGIGSPMLSQEFAIEAPQAASSKLETPKVQVPAGRGSGLARTIKR